MCLPPINYRFLQCFTKRPLSWTFHLAGSAVLAALCASHGRRGCHQQLLPNIGDPQEPAVSLQTSPRSVGGALGQTQCFLSGEASFFSPQGLRPSFTLAGKGASTSEGPRRHRPEMASLQAPISIFSVSLLPPPSYRIRCIFSYRIWCIFFQQSAESFVQLDEYSYEFVWDWGRSGYYIS